MKNETIKKLLIANLIVTVVLVVLVILLLKWTIPSTEYEGYTVRGEDVTGRYTIYGKVVSVTDLPGNKIRIVFVDNRGYSEDYTFSVCEVDEDLVTFEKPSHPGY